MANPRYYPSIPDPISNEDLLGTVRALKQAVEILSGQRGDAPAATVYHSVNPPTLAGRNDLWIRTTDHRMYFWDDRQWVPITT